MGAAPAAVSQHLAKLRLAKLVQPRRDGPFVYYQVHDPQVARLVGQALFPDHEVSHPSGG